MPFLRGTTPIWSTQDLPRRFKEWKTCLVEIGQTAHMPVPIFPWQRTWHINVSRMGGEKKAHADIFVAHCGFQAQ